MDAEKVSSAIKEFAVEHRTALDFIANRQTQLLEIGATVGVVQHYKANGYETTIVNPKGVTEFKVKLGTRGHPADYSRVFCKRGAATCEIHSNLSVEGGRDRGVYCVDVGIVTAGTVPTTKGEKKAPPLRNKYLISFAEAKKLNVYPMLLAHFIGIVHEVKPRYMRSFKRVEVPDDHLMPALITLGRFSGNSKTILASFERRRYKVYIAESFDLRLFYARKSGGQSPFASMEKLRAEAQADGEERAESIKSPEGELDEIPF
jgi:hypothetical protein